MATMAQQQRPGMAPQMRPRILRVGIILGGKIVEEKLLRERQTVTIGQSTKNTFSVPTDGMPRQWPLFLVKDNAYYLHFSDAMDGRVSDGASVHPLPALKGQGAMRSGEGWILPLPETARGKIVLGEMTLLFQFVTAPPLQPRPHLPASVRGTIMDRVEPQLAVVIAASLAFHFSVFFYARCVHDRETGKIDKIYDEVFEPERLAEVEMQPEVPDKATTGDKPQEGAKEPEKGPDKKPKGGGEKPSRGGDNKPGPTREELEEQAALEVEQMFGEGNTGSDSGGLRDRDPGRSLSDEAKDVEEGDLKVDLSKGGGDRGPRRGDKQRATGTGPNINTGHGTEDTGGTGPAKVAKKPDVKVDKPDVDEKTSLTPDALLRKIRDQYAHGLKECFKKVLLVDENAAGTLRLKFTVTERGNVSGVAIKGFGYPDLDSCVEAKVNNWVFTPPKDNSGDPTSMTVKLSLPFAGR